MTKRLAVILVLALLSTGCTADVLGRMKGFDVAQIIISQPVREAVDRARNVGRLLASIEALLLAFVCWYRVHTGAPWLTIAKDWFLGILVCAFILLTVGTSAGLEQWIWQVGVYLGELFNPAQGFLMENFDKAVGRHANQILEVQAGAVPNMRAEDSRAVEAIAWQFSSPYAAAL